MAVAGVDLAGHDREVRIAGVAVFLLGVGLALWAVATFLAAGTSPNPRRPTAALAFAGPYRFTRNPMYLGMSVAERGVRDVLERALAAACGAGRDGPRCPSS